MPTATYIALANYTVPSGGAASVTFSSIPATYRDLVYVISGKLENASSTDTRLRVNGDSGSNYSRVFASGNGSTTQSGTTASATHFFSWYAGDVQSQAIGHLMDYSATNKHKTLLTRQGYANDNSMSMQAGRWANTNAITSMEFSTTNDFAEGTTFAIFGIVS